MSSCNMCGDAGEDWIYLVSQEEAVTVVLEDTEAAEQAVAVAATATDTTAAGEEENDKPSKNLDEEEEEEEAASAGAVAQEEESLDDRQEEEEEEEEYPDWYTAEEKEIDRAFRAYFAAGLRADAKIRAGQDEKSKAFWAYTAACERADAKIRDGEHDREEAKRAYNAACQRAYAANINIVDGAGDRAAASGNTGGGVMENPSYDDRRFSIDDMYDRSLGLGSGGAYGESPPPPAYVSLAYVCHPAPAAASIHCPGAPAHYYHYY